jgi:isopropylmalate/homocitrate/citramalate synthase
MRPIANLNLLRPLIVAASGVLLLTLIGAQTAFAASWNGIEPFKSTREDVIKILGKPIGESTDGVLRFNVMGGTVHVSFVSDNFVKAKKLRPELVGTVLEIVLQHENSSDTPVTMKLMDNKAFIRDETKTTTIFRDMKDGLIYTFNDDKLKSTRYTFADSQLSRARR